jgi:hypothetical protein
MSYFETVFSVWTGFFGLPNNFLLNFKSDLPIYLELFYLSRKEWTEGKDKGEMGS